MADQNSIQPFNDFRKSLSSARYDEFKSRPDVKVESEGALEEMRHHLLNLYEDVEVRHTFLESVGHVVDCVWDPAPSRYLGLEGPRTSVTSSSLPSAERLSRRTSHPGSSFPVATTPSLRTILLRTGVPTCISAVRAESAAHDLSQFNELQTCAL
jgi:hypothetical protein